MDQIGTSHITTADAIVFGSAISLIVLIRSLPATSKFSILLAMICGCMVLVIIGVLLLSGQNLNSKAVDLLAWIALWMCFSLWDWNRRRKHSDRTASEPPV